MTAPLVITPGDPEGIGPEVVAGALLRREQEGSPVACVLVGDGPAIRRAAEDAGLAVEQVDRVGAQPSSAAVPYVHPQRDEPIEVASLITAVDAIYAGAASALVTGPVTKVSITERGYPFLGHTELLGELCGGARPVMGFAGGRFKVVLVTTHLPLRRVADKITASRVLRVIRTTAQAMRQQLDTEPRLIVCGLNPHAGEGGLLGQEDADEIAPAVVRARLEGIEAVGPISSEAAFRMAHDERDVIVAMYHDQGLAPLKLVDWGKSVNWTLGLPIIRTSVDHGTARDIAWQGKADCSGMLAAIAWAQQLSLRQAAPPSR